MALNPADIAAVSRLLDQALAVPAEEREAWLASLPAEHHPHLGTLRDMLAQEAELDTDSRLDALPRLPMDESVAHEGDRVGPYRLTREIGRGGMGSVWLAQRADGSFKRQVALKLPRLAWGAGLAERMARERDIGALLEHPNIARLYDAGVDERGRPYLALEFIDGQPIDAWCEAQGLGVRERLKLFVQVVGAVAYAHGRLVVHRDLKPSNVLVTPDGQVHLLDFGIAKLLDEAGADEAGLTQQQGRVLTPHYASPEQVAGESITVQSDVYSLGVLLYELLTGTLPIAPLRNTLAAVEDAILQGDAPLASSRVKERIAAKALRGDVDTILAKAMQREPAQRYATADALGIDIERHLAGDTVSARPDSVAYRLRKALRRHWLGVSAAAAVLVAVLSGAGVAVVQAQRAAHSAERERVVKAFVADVFRVNSQPNPNNVALRPKSAQSLLEGGARLIDARFGGQPDLQAELYAVVGGVFADMGAYAVATDYALRRVELLTLLRADRVAQAEAMLALAEMLVQDRRYPEGELRARRALDLAKGHHDLEAAAQVMLARAQVPQGRMVEAANAVDAAERIVAAAPAEVPAVTRAWILARRGRLFVAQNRGDEAIALHDRAIDLVTASEGALSPAAIELHLDQAWNLFQTKDRAAQAQQHVDVALSALRTLGGAHELRAAFEAGRFAWKSSDRHLSNADRLSVLEASRATLAGTTLPIPAWFVPQVDFWIGAVKAGHGDIAAAVPMLESSAAVLWAALANPVDRWPVAAVLGRAMMDAGQHDSAAHWFAERIDARRQLGETRLPVAVFDHVYLAHNLLMSGQLDAAQAAVDAALQFEAARASGSATVDYDIWRALTGAEIQLARGHARATVALMERLDARSENVHAAAQRRYEEIYGQALCEGGRSREGLELLKRQLAAYESDDLVASAPQPARLRAVAGRCALGTGDRAGALAMAAQARAAFTAQPGVSPYYKAPLFKLESALGLKLPPV